MNFDLYKKFLMDEEKFLYQLDKNLQDQVNKLKIEEASLLNLIRSSDGGGEAAVFSQLQQLPVPTMETSSTELTESKNDDDSDDDLPLADISKKIKQSFEIESNDGEKTNQLNLEQTPMIINEDESVEVPSAGQTSLSLTSNVDLVKKGEESLLLNDAVTDKNVGVKKKVTILKKIVGEEDIESGNDIEWDS